MAILVDLQIANLLLLHYLENSLSWVRVPNSLMAEVQSAKFLNFKFSLNFLRECLDAGQGRVRLGLGQVRLG